jgi:replicative DNA helicase
MSSENDIVTTDSHHQYYPERDYKTGGYKAFGTPFESLCGNCESYYATLYAQGLTTTPFPPKCKKHVLTELQSLKPEDFDAQEEYQEFLVQADPVSWAYRHFSWEARWYQEELLSCSASKKVIRAGRRIGKTATLVILCLWSIFTNKDWTILVIAPYQAQVDKIFDEFEKMMALSPELMTSIKRKSKSPNQRLELHNGSKILGFPSGAKSATGSEKIRGQDANMIVLDEADYLSDSDLEAILAILASYPDCRLWASSTPTGKHAKFFSWCVQKQLGFKEFHFISHESPSWTDEAENLFRSTYDSISYEHEFLAEFGIQAQGVFRNDLIDRALQHYNMPLPRSSPQSRIIMGVDWNGETNGVHIILTEFWGGKYKVLAKEIVKDGQFTQLTAISKIMELDREYGCDYIYVDEGYGRVQIETLHKYGMQNPSSGLHHRVVPYAFNKQIEIRDPRSGLLIKKPAKPFLVNMTVLQLEEDRIILPSSEDTQILVKSKDNEAGNKSPGLVQQMRNFAVERISVLGLPTYTQGDDHTMFAFMLSIVGFILEFSDLRQMNLSTAFYGVSRPDGGTLKESSHPGKENSMTPVIRQLDAGAPKGAFSRNLNSTFQSIRAKDVLRRHMESGNRRAISYHHDPKNINRGASLNKPKDRREQF